MKKIVLLVCSLILMMSVISCKKDDPTPQTGDSFVLQPVPEADGVYNPTMKIATISSDKIDETWNWNNNQLKSIQFKYTTSNISYKGNQISQIATNAVGSIINTTFTYNGNHITKIENNIGDSSALTMLLQHNANNKISHADIEMNQNYVTNLITDILDNIFNGIFGDEKKSNSKLEIESDGGTADLYWNGNNMNQMITQINTRLAVTAGDIKTALENIDPSILGNYAGLIQTIQLLPDETNLPINFGIVDTTNYTFDNKNNPYYGLTYFKLEEIDMFIKGLSQNNILTSSTQRVVNITIHIPIVGDKTFPAPLPTSNQTYLYQYNTQGFPTQVTDNKKSYTITYSN